MSHDKSTLVPQAPQASRRALLRGLAAAATIPAPALATAMGGLPTSPAAVDPIFALIAEHNTAYAEMAAISGAGDLEGRGRDEAMEAAMGHSDDVLLHLLTTPPVTLAGVAALLQHLARHEWDDPDNHSILSGAVEGSPDMADAADGFLGSLAATVRSLVVEGAKS